ncbi:hypothetical protein DEO72_LG7g780 [Vigna unguiculata]|uniref:Uncharacterized protein n=1 Tax=Vigna unguiculata TaxID=3917 RepID=A0A4D6MGW0_VIGUN|nr:hypothetical protein DEO72_LG7g780 [Vigna unguiculata]
MVSSTGDDGGARTTQRSFALAVAGLGIFHGAAMVVFRRDVKRQGAGGGGSLTRRRRRRRRWCADGAVEFCFGMRRKITMARRKGGCSGKSQVWRGKLTAMR